MPGTFKKFMTYRSRGYLLSLHVRCLFIGRGKHKHNTVHHYFHCFTNWLLWLEELLHDLSPRNEENNTAAKYIVLVFKVLVY